MQYRSHRGGVYYTPENTMPAFWDALKQNYAYIETDPQYTSDGVIFGDDFDHALKIHYLNTLGID